MYSVFIVDDEPIVLDGIRSRIDWESNGFTFAGEAGDGEIALSMIHEIKPDILITDIKMPFMDGLQLAEEVKKSQPWIKIIILSGHDEFDYAKKAISIGIQDYVLKPFTPEEILNSLNKAASEIDREKKQYSDISRMKEELKSKEKLIKKEFLNNLVHGSADLNNIVQKCDDLKINLLSRYYKVLISRIDSLTGNQQNQQETCSLINSYSSSWDQAECFFHHTNLLVCIFKGSSQEELEDNVFKAAESISHITGKNSDCVCLTAIGLTVEHLFDLKKSYEDAKQILSSENVQSKNRIISSDDLQSDNSQILELNENDPFIDRLKYAGKNEIAAIIDESMTLVRKNSGQFKVFASYILVDLIFEVSKLIERLGGDIKQLRPEIISRNFIDEAVENEEKLSSHMQALLYFALEYRDSKVTGKYASVIFKAKKYIEENYADQNTTLTTVAQEVAMSPNHFSTIFSQECKTTFIEYLTDVRIENAKKLMRETDMKGYDIAYECGFSDPHYFSYIFKKNTGLSPREYKTSVS
ncbi:response regulator [Treponema sp.]|uniref:response regulator n=1 Tax=Treponema sp. TaxID=166 RepID=UPI0025E74949|nr:response regulator [Treponema sp.]MCR5217145.1 response regulator [Treponema sp.]